MSILGLGRGNRSGSGDRSKPADRAKFLEELKIILSAYLDAKLAASA